MQLIETEEELLYLSLTKPDVFSHSAVSQSPLRLASSVKAINLMELIAPMYEAQMIQFLDGTPATFSQLIRSFEWLFNFSYKDRERRIKTELYDRKRGETKFLDELKTILLRKNTNL